MFHVKGVGQGEKKGGGYMSIHMSARVNTDPRMCLNCGFSFVKSSLESSVFLILPQN
jgi:hypothetical protein